MDVSHELTAADMDDVPDLDPRRTIVFHSRADEKLCNSVSAPFYRQQILAAHKWARQQGINTFLTDYITPLGILALETLLELRKTDDSFQVFSFRSNHVRTRKTYRTIPETDLELILLVTQADYCYCGISYFVTQASVTCSERGIWITKEPLPSHLLKAWELPKFCTASPKDAEIF